MEPHFAPVQAWLAQQSPHPHGNDLKKLDWLIDLAKSKQANYQLGEQHPGVAFAQFPSFPNEHIEQAMAIARQLLLHEQWSPLDRAQAASLPSSAVISGRLAQLVMELVQQWRNAGFVAAFGARLVDGRRLYWPWLPPALSVRMPLLQWVPTAWLWRPDVGYFVALDVALDAKLAALRRFTPSQPPWLGHEAYTAPYPLPWFASAHIATIGPIVAQQDWLDVLSIRLPPEIRVLRAVESPLVAAPYVGDSPADQAMAQLLSVYWQALRDMAWQQPNLWTLLQQALVVARQQDGLAWLLHAQQLKLERAALWAHWGEFLQVGVGAAMRQVAP